MASNDPSHRRTQTANSIPLQDLSENGGASEEYDLGVNRRSSHRRNFSERLPRLRQGSRRQGGNASSRYARVAGGSPSPPARRDGPVSPVAFVTSPAGEHQRIPDEDDEGAFSPIDDVGAFQAAIGFAGLSINANLPSEADDDTDEMEETPSRPAPLTRATRASLPSLRTNRDSLDSDMVSVQLNDGPTFFSPGLQDEDDTLPLTGTPKDRPATIAAASSLPPEGQRHDRSRGLSTGHSLSPTVRFVPNPNRGTSMLGDNLRPLDTNSPDSRLDRSPSSRKHSLSLSPASAESPLMRTGTMLRKMSQRVVNVSNEQVDTLVSRSIKRKSTLRKPSLPIPPPPTIVESESTDFAMLDGTNSRRSEKSPSPAIDPEPPPELPRIERNPLRGKSLGVFPPESPLRRGLLDLLVNPLAEGFILLLIVVQTVLLAIDSAQDVYLNPRPKGWGNTWTDYAMFGIFCVYTAEIIVKVIVSGLILNPREYSTIDRSNGIKDGLQKKANELFALHRKDSMKESRNAPERPEAPPSLLRSFTADTFEDIPGGSRQAAKKRLAHRAFLRHSFNRLDFVAVVAYWISFVLNFFDLQSKAHIYVFNMMSCLRIIRLLSMTSGTSVILRSLKRAAPTLLNVSFLIGFFWLLFAIAGVQSFKASMRRTCVWDGSRADPPQDNYTLNYAGGNGNVQFCGGWRADNGTMMPWLMPDGSYGADEHKGYVCPVGSYCVQGMNPYNNTVSFDNIANSLELVFVVLSTNTFSDIMYNLTNTDYLAAALYFAAGIVLLTFWLVNLLIAVITSSFQVIREESRSSAFMAEETDAEKDENVEEIDEFYDGESRYREPRIKKIYRKSKWVWIAIIVYGLIVNCLRNATMGAFLSNFIWVSELGVTLALFIEIILRFVVDWRGFIFHFQNWFDLCLAIITTVIEVPSVRNAYDGQAYAWLSVFQVMRVYRVVLAISITRELILLVLKHVSGVLNLILFVFLLTFLASIFAVQLFRGELPRTQPSGATIYVTFSTIYNAYLGMYQILSSENWTDILYNVQAADVRFSTSWIGAIFVILWFVFAFFITLNLFIAVIQENFDVSEDQKRVQQVRMFLQQKEAGYNTQGTLSLSTIFKFRLIHKQDPLEYGSAATDMLLKDGIVREFLDDDLEMDTNGSANPANLKGQTTFDLMQGKDVVVGSWIKRLFSRYYDNEPNPFYTKIHMTKFEQADPRTLAKEVVNAAEQRKATQRSYLRRHPKYNVSMYLFPYNHPLRKFCQRIVGPGRGGERIEGVAPNITVWYSFSAFIYLAIVAMVVLACVTTPLYQHQYFRTHDYSRLNWFTFTDIGFASLFTVEALVKIIADGFFWTPHAYLRSSWGFIDSIVLLTLWVDVVTTLYDPGGGSRAVGAFKALRALRLLNVSDSARDTFHSVIVLGGWKVLSAMFVSLSLLIPFAIYGLNLFAGKMMFCNQQNGSGNPINDPFRPHHLTDCVGEYYSIASNWEFPAPRVVQNSWYDFDNFGDALLVLFQIVSQEGWVAVMWSAESISGIFTQPSNFASQGNAVYFVIFNLLGAVFVLTLFVSVFMRNYTEQTGVAFLTAEQRSWLELRKLLKQVAPSKRPTAKKKREGWKEWCYRRAVTKTGWYQRTVTGVLILHLLLLCLEYYPEPFAWSRTRDYIYLAFTAVYIVNIIIRIIGLSWTRFRKSAWDLYSLFAVAGTFVTTVLLLSNFGSRDFTQLHKLFLVSIALLLIPRNNQLDQLFKTAAASLSSIANLLATWFVLFLVYAIAMNQAFGLTRFYWNEDSNINFRTVPKALILLFRMSVGEGWNMLMEDFARVVPPYCTIGDTYFEGDCGSAAWARFLFISWNILSMYIFVNLFISLIYESFSYVYQRSSGLSIISREEIRRFKQAWAEFDPNGTGFISREVFPRFLGELSGVFEMRIYDGDFSVRSLIDDCKLEPKRVSALSFDGPSAGPAEIDIDRLNRRLAELPVEQIRRRRARMNTFYEEVLISADPDRGIPFTTVLRTLAHYKVINESKALKMEEFLRRRARLERVEQTVNREIVRGFFETLYWSRRFRRYKETKQQARITAIPQLGVPEIFVQDESDDEDPTRASKFDNIPYVAVTPVDYEPSEGNGSLGIGRAPSSGSDAGYGSRQSLSEMRNRSGSIQASDSSSPKETSYLSTRGHRPTASSSSIQPDWHFAAAIESASGLSPPASPGLSSGFEPRRSHEEAAARNRAHSAVSQNEMMGMFESSAWGRSMRRSATQRRRGSQRRPSS